MRGTQHLSESLEDYLETILAIIQEQQVAHGGDIAEAMAVRHSSVTNALHRLEARALIEYAPYQAISLTPKGRGIAAEVTRKHTILSRFLRQVLCVEPWIADAQACRLEHVVADHVLSRIERIIEMFAASPHADAAWAQQIEPENAP